MNTIKPAHRQLSVSSPHMFDHLFFYFSGDIVSRYNIYLYKPRGLFRESDEADVHFISLTSDLLISPVANSSSDLNFLLKMFSIPRSKMSPKSSKQV